jgi:hypothetical protein
MKKILCGFLLLFGVFILSQHAFADSVIGTSGYGFQTWTTANLDQNSTPYWDHGSSDGSYKNIGYYLTNSGFFDKSAAGPGAIPYWGTSYASGGSADPNFYLQSTGSNYASLMIEIAGNATTNEFGWYEIDNKGVAGTMHTIFAGSASDGAKATFTPSDNYGFYLKTNSNGTFRTQSVQGNDSGNQHFALFQGSNGYWLGMEDLVLSGSDKDYNDMIVKITPTPIPAAFWLFGSALAGLIGMRKKIMK